MKERVRVVVTGLGAITPVGNDVPTLWKTLAEGHSGVGLITHFDASSLVTRIAAEVKDFDPREHLGHKEARRLDRFIQFAVVAVEQAIADEDADFFVANSLTQSVPCTAEEADAGYICGPEEIGETITGVPYGWEASEGILMPLEDYLELWVQLFASNLPAESDSEGR